MQLVFNVNQPEAMRRGIDAPSSTAKIDVNPGALDTSERDVLAAIMQHGHDCTQLGLDIGAEGLRGSANGIKITLVDPSFEGMRDAIRDALDRLEAARQERREYINERRRMEDEEIAQLLNQPPRTGKTRVYYRGGKLMSGSSFIEPSIEVEVPMPIRETWQHASPEMLQRLRQRNDEIREARERIVHESVPALEDKIRTIRRQEEAQEAEKARLYARLPQTLRARYEAGYATDDEIEEAMCDLARRDAGLPSPEEYTSAEEAESLSDAQFERLREIQDSAPEGADVVARRVWDYRPAEDDDDPRDIDRDGEVECNIRHVALIRWVVGGMTVRSDVRLDD